MTIILAAWLRYFYGMQSSGSGGLLPAGWQAAQKK
jgi:hypothetical protein